MGSHATCRREGCMARREKRRRQWIDRCSRFPRSLHTCGSGRCCQQRRQARTLASPICLKRPGQLTSQSRSDPPQGLQVNLTHELYFGIVDIVLSVAPASFPPPGSMECIAFLSRKQEGAPFRSAEQLTVPSHHVGHAVEARDVPAR